MVKARTSSNDAGQLTLFGIMEYISTGDGTYQAVVRPPVRMASITVAARTVGKSRANIYRLFRTGFIAGDQSSPGKIQINMESLHAHLQASREPDYWTAARKKQYRG